MSLKYEPASEPLHISHAHPPTRFSWRVSLPRNFEGYDQICTTQVPKLQPQDGGLLGGFGVQELELKVEGLRLELSG